MKSKMEITRKIVFHTGHMLKDDESKCHNPHGHEYVLEATITGPVQEEGVNTGMVLNFGDLKSAMMLKIHDLVDHKFIVELQDPRYEDFLRAVGCEGVHPVHFSPTAENLVKYFFNILAAELHRHHSEVKLVRCKLQETYQCWVEYSGFFNS
jgi:6-pyruvoyltetrahydropterin/6-carboxytetrahydropterin synthase